ncbi:MAG: hypothetical protein ABIH18_08330 [Candidatus Omnitrophota bacterium]
MNTFSFLSHPMNISQLKELWPLTRFIPYPFMNSFLKYFLSVKVVKIDSSGPKYNHNIIDNKINGFIIWMPLLPVNMERASEKYSSTRIDYALKLSKNYGAAILGLDRLFAVRKYVSSEKHGIPVNKGNYLAAWTIFESVYRAAKVKKINFKNCTVLIIGMQDSLGVLCAKKISAHVSQCVVFDQNMDREYLKKRLKEQAVDLSVEVISRNDLDKAVKESDICICTSQDKTKVLDIGELKLHSIVCYMDQNDKFASEVRIRKDVTVISGGLIKLPYNEKEISFYGRDYPKNIVPAAMAETMLLTLEGKLINYTTNDNANPDKLDEIADIATKYGFEVWVPEAPVI